MRNREKYIFEGEGVDVWDRANNALADLAVSTQAGFCHANKTDFRVTFEGGDEYDGTFLLTGSGNSTEGFDLKSHMGTFQRYHAGTLCPSHHNKIEYLTMIELNKQSGSVEGAQHAIDTLDIEPNCIDGYIVVDPDVDGWTMDV
jgi:hypothetical protein